MEWKNLLSVERQNKKTANLYKRVSLKTVGEEFDEDYLAIISSQAFRRLQDKTQVFFLDRSDFVRTRLTHSIEVSTIARKLAHLAINKLVEENSPNRDRVLKTMQEIPDFTHAVGTVVACAGLLHDTGNPPYGHYGENVIRKWFEAQFARQDFAYNGRPIGAILNRQMKADFTRFEGNAQGLRIMSKSRLKKNSHDMNLTYAVMNTLVKYPNPSDFTPVEEDVKKHKNGYYYAEDSIMQAIGKATGTLLDADKKEYARHPLVYIMEAADDIAYATADLEDSVMKHCFTVDEFIQYYEKRADQLDQKEMGALLDAQPTVELKEKVERYIHIRNHMKAEARKGSQYKDQAKLDAWVAERNALFVTPEEKSVWKQLESKADAYNTVMRNIVRLRSALSKQELRTQETDFVVFENWLAGIREALIDSAAFAFSHNYDAIMEGSYLDDLFAGTFVEDTIRILKGAMVTYVYDCDDLVEMELAAKKVVETLLESFAHAALYYGEDESKMSVIDDRFIRRIPANFREDYNGAKAMVEASDKTEEEKDAEKIYLRLLMVTDYISGMTDSYASNLYKVINGIL